MPGRRLVLSISRVGAASVLVSTINTVPDSAGVGEAGGDGLFGSGGGVENLDDIEGDPASRRRPCASLALHLHPVVKRTFTFKLSKMPDTPIKWAATESGPPIHIQIDSMRPKGEVLARLSKEERRTTGGGA